MHYNDVIADAVTDRFNRVKGKNVQVDMVVPFPQDVHSQHYMWEKVASVEFKKGYQVQLGGAPRYVITSESGRSRMVTGGQFVQVHSSHVVEDRT
jgi:hypothetical protein